MPNPGSNRCSPSGAATHWGRDIQWSTLGAGYFTIFPLEDSPDEGPSPHRLFCQAWACIYIDRSPALYYVAGWMGRVNSRWTFGFLLHPLAYNEYGLL